MPLLAVAIVFRRQDDQGADQWLQRARRGRQTATVATMPTKITFIYENPQDVDAFEADYPSQLALAKRIPGVLGVETARVWPIAFMTVATADAPVCPGRPRGDRD